MVEIGFYHLVRATLVQALPQLLGRTLAAGQRAVVVGSDDKALQMLSAALWANPDWLPHGTITDGDPDLQPIWLSTTAEPLNGARFLFLVGVAWKGRIEDYTRVFDLFDGKDEEAVVAARLRWKAAKEVGYKLTYWQQTESGWQKKSA